MVKTTVTAVRSRITAALVVCIGAALVAVGRVTTVGSVSLPLGRLSLLGVLGMGIFVIGLSNVLGGGKNDKGPGGAPANGEPRRRSRAE